MLGAVLGASEGELLRVGLLGEVLGTALSETGLRAVGLELGVLLGLAVGECFSAGLLSEPVEGFGVH